MDERTFIATYVANFMARHAATNYMKAIMAGTQKNLYSKEKIEFVEVLGLQTREVLNGEHKDTPDPYLCSFCV